jgi:acetyl-CoA synthetase
MGDESQRLSNLLTENRVFPPSEEFAAQANATAAMYDEANADREDFWAGQAHRLHWDTDFEQVLDWSNAPFAKSFIGGKLNVAYHCVDRLAAGGVQGRQRLAVAGPAGR